MPVKFKFTVFAAFEPFFGGLVTFGVSCGADFGERQRPVGRDVHARICGSKITNPALKFTLLLAAGFYY